MCVCVCFVAFLCGFCFLHRGGGGGAWDGGGVLIIVIVVNCFIYFPAYIQLKLKLAITETAN